MAALSPSSRWLGLNLSSSDTGRALNPAEARRQGGLWRAALPPASICGLLMLSGRALWHESVQPSQQRTRALESSILWLHSDRLEDHHLELAGVANHSALLLVFPIAWIMRELGAAAGDLSGDWRALFLNHRGHAALVRPLEPEDRAWARGLMAPSLCEAARLLLEGSRMNEFFFRKVLLDAQSQEFFCHRTRRVALERVERVRQALKARLDQPPTLAELARLCGCNPHYLSRTFTEAAGMTITHYLRKLRIEEAMTLMARGTHNTSEAALDVGYQSMSHFSVAFRQVQGLSPSEWLRQQRDQSRPLPALKAAAKSTTATRRFVCG